MIPVYDAPVDEVLQAFVELLPGNACLLVPLH